MDMVTSIAALSVVQHQQQLKTDVASSLMGKAMDTNKQTAAALLDMMQSAVPASRPGGMDFRV